MSPSDYLKNKRSTMHFFLILVGALIFVSLAKDVLFSFWSYGYELELFEILANNDASWDDSWGPMYSAAWVRVFEPELSLYQTIFFDDNTKFQYPPVSLLPFMFLVSIGVEAEALYYYMGYVSMLFVVGIGYVAYRIASSCGANFYDEDLGRSIGPRLFLFFLIFVGTITFYPIVFGVYLGQIQVLLDLLICVGFLAWINDRKAVSGVFIAIAALVKPQYLLILIWSLVRKEHKFTLGMVAVFIPAAIVSLAVFGFQEHLDYVAVVSHIGKHGEIYWPNQSMNGLLNRLLSGLDPLEFSPFEFAPYNTVVHFGTLFTTTILILLGLFYKRPKSAELAYGIQKRDSVLDLGMMIVIATIASPVAWEHHYGVTWPIIIIAIMVAIDVCQRRQDWRALLCLGLVSLSYLLISNYFYFITKKQTLSLPPWNIAQSYIYFGGLSLLACLIILRRLNISKSSTTMIDVKTNQ